jgi:hypothetical protein
MTMISTATTSAELVNAQNKLIDENITYRRQWEDDCKKVQLSYRGNKFPVKDYDNKTQILGQAIRQSSNKKATVNLVKRQWRVISNYLLNNEPQYLLTQMDDGTTEEQLHEKRELLDQIFDGWEEEHEGFYDSVMDDTIFYGIHRGICWTLVYFDPKTKKYCFKSYDPLDTYVDLGVDKLSQIRKFITTYNSSKAQLRLKYTEDAFWEAIDWDKVWEKDEVTASDVKKSMLIEKQGTDSILLREWYYIENDVLWRVVTSKTLALTKPEKIADMKFIPVTFYAPMADPGEIYPRGWFVDMVDIEREINLLMQKMNMIIKTGGRFVYVRTGTQLTKSTNNLLNSLGIEVIEVAGWQEVPKQAQLLQISQSDIEYLNLLMKNAEEEWGMKWDIMGTSTTGANASGRAIQALQAWSKNNIGSALNELNKYMSRLVRILFNMMDYFPTAQYYSAELGGNVSTEPWMNKKIRVKVSITGRDAFDEVTKQMNAIDILNMVQKFAPDTHFPPSIITKIMGVTNDIADEIEEELSKQENPDLQIAEGQAKKMLQGIPQNANENDDHQVFIGIFSEALKTVPPNTPAANALLDAIRMHQAFLQAPKGNTPPGQNPNTPPPWPQ